MVFVVYTMEGGFGFSWCTPWKGILQFRGVYTMEAKNGFRGVHHGRGFCNFMEYTPGQQKMVFVGYTMEGDFAISWESGQVALVLFNNHLVPSAGRPMYFLVIRAGHPTYFLVIRLGCPRRFLVIRVGCNCSSFSCIV